MMITTLSCSSSSSSFMLNTILFIAVAAVSCVVVTKAWQQQHQPPGGSIKKKKKKPATATSTKSEKQSSSSNSPENNNNSRQMMISLAFLGNSMLYYNDCPRLVERLLLEFSGNGNNNQVVTTIVHQDSCLRGGATLTSLWKQGNGMQKKFHTQQAKKEKYTGEHDDDDDDDDDDEYDIGAPTVMDLIQNQQTWWQQQQEEICTTPTSTISTTRQAFIIINDHTQHPARQATREESLQILKSTYAPLIYNNNSSFYSYSTTVIIIFIQTPAYKFINMRNTNDLGNLNNFTRRVADGVVQYTHLMRKERNSYLQQQKQQNNDNAIKKCNDNKNDNSNNSDDDNDDTWCRVAPVGQAYQILHETNLPLWEKLYNWDNFHPSPHGTYLQACILYCTITRQPVPLVQVLEEQNESEASFPLILQQVSDTSWWKSWCRIMQPPDENPLPLPTQQEALELQQVASMVCGV